MGLTLPSGRRDFEALEGRRHTAARLFASGQTQASVARLLEVSRQSVSRWHHDWSSDGVAGLQAAGRAGRLPKLSPDQLGRLDAELRRGPRAHGFSTELWSLPRIARVIERQLGVRYHPGHVWKILDAMDWSLQRPGKRAKERKEEAVLKWVTETWPELKKTPKPAKRGSSSKTKAASRSDRRSAGSGRQKAKRQP